MQNVTLHLKSIYEESELDESATSAGQKKSEVFLQVSTGIFTMQHDIG